MKGHLKYDVFCSNIVSVTLNLLGILTIIPKDLRIVVVNFFFRLNVLEELKLMRKLPGQLFYVHQNVQVR